MTARFVMRTENDLWRAILPVIQEGVAPFEGVVVKRAYQPATQADGENPRVVVHRVSSRRHGFQGAKTVSRDGGLFTVETWFKEDTFRAEALVDRAADDDAFTAGDVLEGLGAYLQSLAAADAFRKREIGILRIRDVTETPYEDSRGTFRKRAGVHFVITYKQTTEREVPKLTRVERGLYRV